MWWISFDLTDLQMFCFVFSPFSCLQLAACMNSINPVERNIKCDILVCIVFGKNKDRELGFPLLYSEIGLCEWVYCMFPLLCFSTFYLWHLGQPPTHSAFSGCSIRGATVKHSPQLLGISPGVVLMQCVCICVCMYLCARVYLSTSRGLPELQTEGEEQS